MHTWSDPQSEAVRQAPFGCDTQVPRKSHQEPLAQSPSLVQLWVGVQVPLWHAEPVAQSPSVVQLPSPGAQRPLWQTCPPAQSAPVVHGVPVRQKPFGVQIWPLPQSEDVVHSGPEGRQVPLSQMLPGAQSALVLQLGVGPPP